MALFEFSQYLREAGRNGLCRGIAVNPAETPVERIALPADRLLGSRSGFFRAFALSATGRCHTENFTDCHTHTVHLRAAFAKETHGPRPWFRMLTGRTSTRPYGKSQVLVASTSDHLPRPAHYLGENNMCREYFFTV
ncbi:MAG TPA: hypothetical protein VF449_05890 [Parvibaculum sp.]